MHPTRIFKTPEDLWKAFENYKTQVEKESSQWLKVQYVGKDGERVQEPQKIPMTLEGFYVYCYDNHGQVSQYFDNKESYYQDFVGTVNRIKLEIRKNQITGAAIGVFKENLISRLNNIKEQTDITTNGEKLPAQNAVDLSKLDSETLKKLLGE